MAPQQSSLLQQQLPSAWRKSVFHCTLLLSVLSCTMTNISLVEARTPPASLSAARSVLPALRTNIDAPLDTTLPRGGGTTRSRRFGFPASFIGKRSPSSPSALASSLNGTNIDIDSEWISTGHVMKKIRGGSAASDTEEESDEEYDDESEEEYDEEEEELTDDEYEAESSEDEYDSEEEEEEEEEVATTKSSSSLKSSLLSKTAKGAEAVKEVEYDDLLTPPAMQQFGVSIGVMMLANRIDITNAKAVNIARFAFLSYIVLVEIFLLYARYRAKSTNDRTEITLSNPLGSLASQLVPGGAGGAAGGGMVKALADQVLSSQTTVLEYDLKTIKKMNGALLFPMVFLYFLHFKMKQVQPLLQQTATGVLNLVYSPLFQVYVLGRNLERPFKPPVNPMMEAMQKGQEDVVGDGDGDNASATVASEAGTEDIDVKAEEDGSEYEEESDEEESDEEVESDEEEESDEYDSDDE